jgi:hypothetical protein
MLLALLATAATQTLPALPAEPDRPYREFRQQVFIAPSGEPFRAAQDAPYPVAEWFARADANHDGRLTEAEFTADFVRFCASLDVNHDGVIDAEEIDRYETTIAPEVHASDFGGGGPGAGERRGGGGGRHGGHRGGGRGGGDEGRESSGSSARPVGSYGNRPQGAGRFDLLGLPEPVSAMDTDFRARIGRQDVLDAAGVRFGALDTQHHGYLTLGDLPETAAQSRRKGFNGRRKGERPAG